MQQAHACPPTKRRKVMCMTYQRSMWWRYGIVHEGFQNWRVLEIGCKHHGMLSKVEYKCVATPTSHGFDAVKRYTTEKILQGAADSNPMPF